MVNRASLFGKVLGTVRKAETGWKWVRKQSESQAGKRK